MVAGPCLEIPGAGGQSHATKSGPRRRGEDDAEVCGRILRTIDKYRQLPTPFFIQFPNISM